jgi:hypothetical protein
MRKNMKIVSMGLILIGTLAVSCSSAGQEPTPDVAAVQTEAVMQAMAQLTVDAALNPTDTPVPATMTPLPTATLNNITPSPTTKVVYSGGSSSSSSSSGTKVPTLTPDVYICAITNQTPWDGPQMTGWIFDVVWTVKNLGVVTWDKNEFYVTWIEDESTDKSDFSPKHTYPLKVDVDPYESIDIIVDFQMPTQPFDKMRISQWGIVNDNGEIFCRFYYAVTYTYPAPTKTPK